MYKDWIKEEGIYFFGGQDSTFEPLASLYILKIDVRPLHWIIPETKGLPPDARYDHSMVYNELLGLLVIYGGRNDKYVSTLILVLTVMTAFSRTFAFSMCTSCAGVQFRYTACPGLLEVAILRHNWRRK
jgi:hypothetical protein